MINEWLLSSLWQANGSKCTIGIADTIFVEQGFANLWLFTSKNGQVVKKKEIVRDEVIDRFTRISFAANSNVSKRVAMLYYRNGTRRLVNMDEFSVQLKDFPKVDESMVAMQPCLTTKRGQCTIWRNGFKAAADKSRHITNTKKTNFLNGNEDPVTPVVNIPASKSFDTACRAANINSSLDVLTGQLIRYMEVNRYVRINECVLDYTIDEDSQVWLLWIAGSNGAHLERSAKSKAEVQVVETSLKEASNRRRSTMYLKEANAIIVPTAKGGHSTFKEKLENAPLEGIIDPDSPENVNGGNGAFPNPLRCSGQYCSYNVRDSTTQAAKKLFTVDELECLGSKVGAISSNLTKAADKYYTITYKSIALAKSENRGHVNDIQPAISKTDTARSTLMKDTVSKSIRTQWASNIGEMQGGTANYYRQVKVCSTCNTIYTMLDTARDIIGKERDKLRENDKNLARKKWNTNVQEEVRQMEGILRRSGSEVKRLDAPIEEQSLNRSKDRSPRESTMLPEVTSASLLETRSTKSPKATADQSSVDEIVAGNSRRINWKDYDKNVALPSNLKKKWRKLPAVQNSDSPETYMGIDNYLRGKSRRRAKKLLRQNSVFGNGQGVFQQERSTGNSTVNILLVEEDDKAVNGVLDTLDPNNYYIDRLSDGYKALNTLKLNFYDIVLCGRDMPGLNAIDLSKLLRQHETQEGMAAGVPPKRSKILCFTSCTSPDDLNLYAEAGMDGCISKPLDPKSLLRTIAAALPDFIPKKKIASKVQSNQKVEQPKGPPAAKKAGISKGNAGAANPLPMKAQQSQLSAVGKFQMDADTVIPYEIVTKGAVLRPAEKSSEQSFFHLVVVNDFFDTYERMKIFLQPILIRYPGVQVLLWNYPGQAFTTWRKDVLLNNEYLASCLSALLHHVGDSGTKEFKSEPFLLMGFGNGGNICQAYGAGFPSQYMRSILLVNAYSYIDNHLSSVLHDCMNVFSCSPESRPDLPVYFFTRFLFSGPFLAKVSAPMALNLYTAVHNPISLEGRIQLCRGALNHIDMRKPLASINAPVICLCSSDDALIKPEHAEALVNARGGEHESIHEVLKTRKKTFVIWLKSGHEVFLEGKKKVEALLEQFVTGYHEKYEVPKHNLSIVEPSKSGISNEPSSGHQNFEDRFFDQVLSSIHDTADEKRISSHVVKDTAKIEEKKQEWHAFRNKANKVSTAMCRDTKAAQSSPQPVTVVTKVKSNAHADPNNPAFERQSNSVYTTGNGNRIYPNPDEMPEVKEYMGWRVRRNKKKLERLERAASTIQKAFRAFLARTLIFRMIQKRASMVIQRTWRGKSGRKRFHAMKKMDWAVRLVQRSWRGRQGREQFSERRQMRKAAIVIQRVARGVLSRKFVTSLLLTRYNSALLIQRIFRRQLAMIRAYEKRQELNAAIIIQKNCRGRIGRNRAKFERDQFLFSKAQAQGIEFGRQMLVEHKLHGTKLQSQVILLTKEKGIAEANVESLLEEITEFEEGVGMLEKEMHELSKVEAASTEILDEDARWQLRDKKMRLDREFGSMLGKIAERKERLESLEHKLQCIDQERQGKEEELRDLEKKLVVLLESQQKELENIKTKQNSRTQMLVDVAGGKAQPGVMLARQAGSGGEMQVGSGGVTKKQREEANALVESTETMMKFGFMSMSMTYFSSMNMIKAMRKVGVHQTLLDGSANASPGGGSNVSNSEAFRPALKAGQMPGQESLLVRDWSVEDVGRWLDTLSLGQYKDAFADAAVDGAFLYDLVDEDYKNMLGIEHGLHRKKLLNSVDRLRIAEGQMAQNLTLSSNPPEELKEPSPQVSKVASSIGKPPSVDSPGPTNKTVVATPESTPQKPNIVTATFNELAMMVRHGKTKALKKAIEPVSESRFDKSTVKNPYDSALGTVYTDATTSQIFHMNMVDDKGNSLLLMAAQNNNMNIAELLTKKGCNVNHQNRQGQTAAHYAMAYSFFDLGAWLLDPDKGGARDDIENMFHLTPYDGLGG